jgi:uncharacterized protein (DUF2141 family)
MSLKRRRAAPFVFTVLMLIAFSFPLYMFAPTVKAAVLYDSGDPTPAEQLILEYVNRARSDPVAEGQRLGIDIHEGLPDPSLVGPRPPLAMNKILLSIAQTHSQNMYNLNYFSHNDPNGDTPFDRMTHAGYDYLTAGENMAGGQGTTGAKLEDLIMVDAGTPGRGHRVNLLDLFNPYPCGNPLCVYSEVGIGYYGAASPNGIGLNSLLTEDFGAAASGPFLLGVVYNDLNNNNFYDIGEGIAGVAITPSSGGYYAVTSSSGGYAIPIDISGTITVTASGPGFGPITKTVTLDGANVKLDFTASAQTSSTASTSTQTSTTSTLIITSSTAVTTSSTHTTTSVVNLPSIALNLLSASAGSTVDVTGSGFSSGDATCSLSGNAIGTSNCSISGGTLTASFVVANVAVGTYSVAATGSPAGDSASAIFTVSASTSQTTTSTNSSTTLTSTQTTQIITTTSSYTTSFSSSQETTTTNTQTSTTNTPLTVSDFSLSASSNAINLVQSSTGDLIVSVQSIGSFDQQIHLEGTGLPMGVEISFSPDPVSPSEGGTISSTATLIVTRSVPTGIYPFTIVATSGSVSKQIPLSLRVSGCLIATATFGSELAPEVQFLRDFRDYKILQTFAGTSFMVAFNTWYYSFSPGVAQYESTHTIMRSAAKFILYPLIWILKFGSAVFDLASFNQEGAVIVSGLSVSALLGAIYLAGPLAILRLRLPTKTRRVARRLEKAFFFVLVGSLVTLMLSEVLGSEMLIMSVASIAVLATVMASALWTSRTLTELHKPTK